MSAALKDKELVPLDTPSGKDLEQLLQQVGIERLKRGKFLFRRGDTDPGNIYLLSGEVSLLLDKAGAGAMDLETLGKQRNEAEARARMLERRLLKNHQEHEQAQKALSAEIESLKRTLKDHKDEWAAAEEIRRDAMVMQKELLKELESLESAHETVKAELREALAKLDRRFETGADAAEREAMRQELDSLRLSLDERHLELELALTEQRSLEDALEDRDSHLELVRRELEQSRAELEELTARCRKAEDGRIRAEATLGQLRNQAEPAQGSGRVDGSAKAMRRAGVRPVLLGLLLGMLVGFGAPEAWMALHAKDGILSGLSGGVRQKAADLWTRITGDAGEEGMVQKNAARGRHSLTRILP
ncbi:MAG TPA: hypothetical protein ENI99_08335 [Sedimenticola sp.]|nr:hypothetical protein [Sedimenticola sp.]